MRIGDQIIWHSPPWHRFRPQIERKLETQTGSVLISGVSGSMACFISRKLLLARGEGMHAKRIRPHTDSNSPDSIRCRQLIYR